MYRYVSIAHICYVYTMTRILLLYVHLMSLLQKLMNAWMTPVMSMPHVPTQLVATPVTAMLVSLVVG